MINFATTKITDAGPRALVCECVWQQHVAMVAVSANK